LLQLDEVEELANRAFTSLHHYYAHEYRAAHESSIAERSLEMLDEHGILVTMDWKMKFLAYLYRESQQSFFGKAGIGWHGVMVMRKLADGDYAVSYYDQVLSEGKEDSLASLQVRPLTRAAVWGPYGNPCTHVGSVGPISPQCGRALWEGACHCIYGRTMWARNRRSVGGSMPL
jgi:hypothetical protein